MSQIHIRHGGGIDNPPWTDIVNQVPHRFTIFESDRPRGRQDFPGTPMQLTQERDAELPATTEQKNRIHIYDRSVEWKFISITLKTN